MFIWAEAWAPTPNVAIRLEEFTPLERFFPDRGCVRSHIFDRHGDRKDKFHARMKFVVKKFGDDAFRKMVVEERMAVRATRARRNEVDLAPIGKKNLKMPPALTQKIDGERKTGTPLTSCWRKTNVLAQKQAGSSLATVVMPLGDISVPQRASSLTMARKYNNGHLAHDGPAEFAASVDQERAPRRASRRIGSDRFPKPPGALRLADVTRCPGADTCQIAVTKSRGFPAGAILDLFKNGLARQTWTCRTFISRSRAAPTLAASITSATSASLGPTAKSTAVKCRIINLLIGGDIQRRRREIRPG